MMAIKSILLPVLFCFLQSVLCQTIKHQPDVPFYQDENQKYQNETSFQRPQQRFRRANQAGRISFYQSGDLDFLNLSRFNIPARIQELTSSFGVDQFGGLVGRRRSGNLQESARCDMRQETSSFFFFSRANTGNEYQAKLTRFSSTSELEQINLNPKKRTYFLIHGWFGCTLSSDGYQILYKDKITTNGANFFIVDWSHFAHDIAYSRSVERMKYAAEDIFELLKNLERAFPNFKRNKIYIVGFSLGAHVAGQLGRLLDGQATQITGLDPAGVQIADLHPKYKLTADDAKYVLALHTNIKNYGTRMNVAHHDIFVNGGLDQPACKNRRNFAISSCNHQMAPAYLSTDSANCVHVAHLCYNWSKFLAGQCGFCKANSTDCIPMTGQLDDSFYKSKGFSFTRSNQRTKDVPWSFKTKDSRYYAVTSASDQYCVYLYQVIVKFADDFKPSTSEYWSAQVRFKDGGDIQLSSFNKLNFKIPTFDNSISGPNVFTALLVVDDSHPSYNSMPQRVNSITLNMSMRDKQTEVYVNFMSSLNYQTRKDKSGKIKQVNWNLVDNASIIKTNE